MFYEPIEPGSPDRDRVALLAARPGDAQEAELPAAARALDEVRVKACPRLQLRRVGFGFAERRYGIDSLGEAVIERVVEETNMRVLPQLLGFPATAQDDPRSDGELALLHFPDGAVPGFDFLDAGDLLFFGASHDVEAGRWDLITAWPGSS